jgi:hypothetical protein
VGPKSEAKVGSIPLRDLRIVTRHPHTPRNTNRKCYQRAVDVPNDAGRRRGVSVRQLRRHLRWDHRGEALTAVAVIRPGRCCAALCELYVFAPDAALRCRSAK